MDSWGGFKLHKGSIIFFEKEHVSPRPPPPLDISPEQTIPSEVKNKGKADF